MSAVAIVPAAGKGERFGGAKLLARFNDEPLINWTLWSLLDGGVATVIVVTAPGADLSEAKLMNDPRVSVVVNEDPSRGMFSSIQAGLAVAHADIVLVLPADMPFVGAATVAAVIARSVATGSVVIPVHQGRRGHPIAIPRARCDELLSHEPTATLKDALAASGATPILLDVSDAGILRDVDVPGDLGR